MICECATYYLTGKELYFIKKLLYLTWKIGLLKLGLTCVGMRLDGLRVKGYSWKWLGRKCFTINLC